MFSKQIILIITSDTALAAVVVRRTREITFRISGVFEMKYFLHHSGTLWVPPIQNDSSDHKSPKTYWRRTKQPATLIADCWVLFYTDLTAEYIAVVPTTSSRSVFPCLSACQQLVLPFSIIRGHTSS